MSTCSFDYEHHMRATALSDEGVNKNLVYDKFSERIYFESRLFNNINDERIELDKVTKSLNRELREQIKKLGFSDEMYKTVVVPNSGLFDKNSVYIEYSPEKHEREIIDAWANEDANFKVVIKTLSQVKKDLSLKNEVTERQKAFLLARLRDYNIKNRTKHSIEFDKVGYSELERTTLKLNFNEKDAIKPRTVITNSKIRIDNRSPEEVRRDKKRFINEDARQAQREDAERAGIEYTDRYLFDQRSRNSEELNEFYRSVIRKVQEKLSVLYPEIKLNITNNPVWEQGDNIFNQIIGTIGASNDSHIISELETAMFLFSKNTDMRTILDITGWQKDLFDNKWKYEIPDIIIHTINFTNVLVSKGYFHNIESKNRIINFFTNSFRDKDITKSNINELKEWIESDYINSGLNNFSDKEIVGAKIFLSTLYPGYNVKFKEVFDISNNQEYKGTLSDIFPHDSKLFKLYPNLKNVNIEIKHNVNEITFSPSGFYNKDDNLISITIESKPKYGKDSNNPMWYINGLNNAILHEIQHYIQNIEGFSTGASTEGFNNNYSSYIYRKYFTNAGEVEARNVSNRRLLSNEERRKLLFIDTIKDVDIDSIWSEVGSENQIIGQANIKAMTVMFDPQFEKKDGETRYHEYAHHYIAWFRNHPLVQEAINKWGSEEALVQSIGEQSVKQKGEAWTWWQNFFKFLQDLLKKLSSKDKNELRNILTDAFLSRIDLDSGTKLSTERIKQLAQEATEGMFNQEIDNMIEKGFIVKKIQELQENGNLATISQSKIDNLQSTIEYQLLNEKDEDLDKKTGQYYIFLSEIDAQRFTYLIEKNKEFPKEFKVTAKITKYEKDPKDPFKFYASNEYVDYYYIKSNKNKKSNLYDLVRKETGEVIASKVRVLSVSKDAKSEIAEKYGLEHTATKIFSANRSIAFALYRQKPSKAKYIAQAKKYLYDAIKFLNPKETNLKINLDKIEDLLNSFPEEMWDYINTTYSPEDSTNINASISLQNEIKFKLPKLGFLQEIEKITGISLQGVSFENYDRSGSLAKVFRYSKLNGEWGDTITIDNSMTTKELKASIRYYLSTKKIFKPTSEEENVRKYAEHRGIDYNKLRELVFGDIEKALDNIAYNNTGNSDTIELSKWRESIRNYDWQSIELFNKPYENFQNTVKERIIAKFKDKNLSNGISHLEYFFSSGAFNWLNINFNNISGQYYMADMETEANVGVETKMGGIINPFEVKIYQKPKAGENFLQEKEVFNRLAAILHEPFHALHALSYGTKEELELRKAFDNLYRTDFGKEMINQVFGSGYNKGQQVSYDTLYKEFTAFTTQIMLYPKQWIKDTDLRSNDIYEFIEKIETLQDKTYEEIVKTKQKIGTTEKVVTEEEKIKLTFLEKLYNYLVKALNKIIPLSKKFTNLIADSKLVEKKVIEDVFGETEEVVIKTLKLPENVKKFKEDFSQAMNELQSAINTLMQIDGKLFSSENITNFFTSNKFNQEINYNLTQKQQALQKKHLKTENIIDNNKEIDFQLDLENLNLTNDVLIFLHENSTKTKDFSTFAKVVKKMIAIWENSGLSTEEITEMIKCL